MLNVKIVTLTFFFRGFERIFYARSHSLKAYRVTFSHFFCFQQKWRKVTICALSTFSFFLSFFCFFFFIFFHFFDFLLSRRADRLLG